MRDLPRYSCSLLVRFPDDVAVARGGCWASCELEKRKDFIKGTDEEPAPLDVFGRELIARGDGWTCE